jgi:histidinol-phosphatase
MNPEWRSRYETARTAAQQAGQLALRYFTGAFTVEWKQDQTPVTVADREAEQLLRATLLCRFPTDGFLGEESGDVPGSSGFRWIIDPIDGTRNFFRGIPIWGTLVGLEYKGEPIAGVVEAPALGHSYRALRGDGAYRGDRRIHVSKVGQLADATVFYTNLTWFQQAGCPEKFFELSARTQVQRGFGDFWGHVLVAEGCGELMVEHGVHIWDVAALQPIIEEAGGRFTDWEGTPTIHRPDVLTSNGHVHDEILRMFRPG